MVTEAATAALKHRAGVWLAVELARKDLPNDRERG